MRQFQFDDHSSSTKIGRSRKITCDEKERHLANCPALGGKKFRKVFNDDAIEKLTFQEQLDLISTIIIITFITREGKRGIIDSID